MTLRPTDFFAIGAAISLWASIHVVLRLLCRHIVKIPFGLDDVWAVAAWIILIGLNISSGYLYLGGHLTEPTDAISPQAMDIVLKAWYANHVMYFCCMLCCKLSLIFLYLRLFTTQLFRIAAFVVAMLCLGAFVGGITPFTIQCKPTSGSLSPGIPDTCLSASMLFLGINLSNFLTNVFVLLLPLPFVWSLNLAVRSRVVLSVVFLLGSVGVVISLVRVVLQNEWLDNWDTMVGVCSLWTVLEPALCLFAACLPALRPLMPSSANGTNPNARVANQRSPRRDTYDGPRDESQTSSGWDEKSNKGSKRPPSNVAYAERYYTRANYGRAFNHVRSSFNPERFSHQDRPGLKQQRSWLEEPDTPPEGIMVRNEVHIEDGERF